MNAPKMSDILSKSVLSLFSLSLLCVYRHDVPCPSSLREVCTTFWTMGFWENTLGYGLHWGYTD